MMKEFKQEMERYREHFGVNIPLMMYDPGTVEELKIIVDTCIEQNKIVDEVYPELYGEREGEYI